MPDAAALSDAELSANCATLPLEKRIGWIGVAIAWAVWFISVDVWSPVQQYGGFGVLAALLWLIAIFAVTTFLSSLPYRRRTRGFREELSRRCDFPEVGEDLLRYVEKRQLLDDAEWVVLLDARFLPHGGRGLFKLTLHRDLPAVLYFAHQSFDSEHPVISRTTQPLSAKSVESIQLHLRAIMAECAKFVPSKRCKDGMPLRLLVHQPATNTTRRYAFNYADVAEEQRNAPVVLLIAALQDAALGKEEILYASCDESGNVSMQQT